MKGVIGGARAGLIVCLLAGSTALPSTQALAIEVKMTCEKKDAKYVVTFDTETNVFTTTNSSLSKEIKVHKVQNDEDGVLVWTSTAIFGGARDILAQFGREKWIKYFYGNGSVVTDPCN